MEDRFSKRPLQSPMKRPVRPSGMNGTRRAWASVWASPLAILVGVAHAAMLLVIVGFAFYVLRPTPPGKSAGLEGLADLIVVAVIQLTPVTLPAALFCFLQMPIARLLTLIAGVCWVLISLLLSTIDSSRFNWFIAVGGLYGVVMCVVAASFGTGFELLTELAPHHQRAKSHDSETSEV